MSFFQDEQFAGGVKTLVYMLKTLYLLGLFLLGMWLIIVFVLPGQEKISLREFPYPYKAAIALSNGIEGTDSIDEFLSIQRYLCTGRDTPWGKGLSLEIGNSFWFYDLSEKSQFTVFHPSIEIDTIVFADTISVETASLIDTAYNYNIDFTIDKAAAKVISDFIRSGYMDALNTYGNFAGYEFDREYAEKAASYLQQNNLRIPIWLNRPGAQSFQNLGRKNSQLGDNIQSSSYHSDLLKLIGVKYINLGGYTAVVGQETEIGLSSWFTKQFEFVKSFFVTVKDEEFDLNHGNNLLNRYTLADSSVFLRFRRFVNSTGVPPRGGVDADYLHRQLTPETLNSLIDAGGYMIMETRFGGNEHQTEWVPAGEREGLIELKRLSKEKKLFVTTTSRLLNYYIVNKTLDWKWEKTGEAYNIHIKSRPRIKSASEAFSLDQLQGLTFYTPSPENTHIYFEDQLIESVQVNETDANGEKSVSIAWKPLKFPEGY